VELTWFQHRRIAVIRVAARASPANKSRRLGAYQIDNQLAAEREQYGRSSSQPLEQMIGLTGPLARLPELSSGRQALEGTRWRGAQQGR
jgi:hypothetical protein